MREKQLGMRTRQRNAPALLFIFLLASVFPASTASAAADAVEDFYKGKRITLYIGSSTAGGTDVYGRTIAQFMGNHIPGNPQVLASNMPGANGLNLANQLYNTLPKDGTAIGTFDRYIPLYGMVGSDRAKFDVNKFAWLGSTNIDVSTCVTWHTSNVTTLKDFMAREVVVGSTAVYHPNILNNIFGGHLKLISGYPGGNDINLALERGEIEARCHWSWSAIIGTRPDWVRDKKINIILQFSETKHPEMPDVPLVTELARNDAERAILALISTTQLMARPFAAPPGVPADRVEALRKAFDKTLGDPDFRVEAARQKLELEPVVGREIQDLVLRVSRTPPDVIRKFRDLVMPPF